MEYKTKFCELIRMGTVVNNYYSNHPEDITIQAERNNNWIADKIVTHFNKMGQKDREQCKRMRDNTINKLYELTQN